MLILAIDSSTPVAGIALLEGDQLIREEFINYKKNHSETLMPLIDELLRSCERNLLDLTALAVTIGPGSFTGLRIGLAAVKGMSLAAAKPVVAISTLDVLAHNIVFSDTLVCPLLNARKQEVYAAMYDNRGCYPRRLNDDIACSPRELAAMALRQAEQAGFDRITLLGDGFDPYRQVFNECLGEKLAQAPCHLMLPRASALGSLAGLRAAQNDFDDVMYLKPSYVRLSEAESKLGKGEL